MRKKYFDSYNLYIGQNTLQVFANFEPDPPLTSYRLSSATSPGLTFEFEEDSDIDSGEGRASPNHPSEDDSEESYDNHEPAKDSDTQDDQFTVLWYGTDIPEDLDDISEEEGIFPDITPEDPIDDISEEEEEDLMSRIRITNFESLSDSEEEGIFPDLPTRDNMENNEDINDIAEEEDEEDEFISRIRIISSEFLPEGTNTCPLLSTRVDYSEEDEIRSRIRTLKPVILSGITNTSPLLPTKPDYLDSQLEIIKTQEYIDDVFPHEINKNDASSPQPLGLIELKSLCSALSNITLNQQPTNDEYVEENNDTKEGEYIEEDDDTKEGKDFTRTEPTATVNTSPATTPTPSAVELESMSDPLADLKTYRQFHYFCDNVKYAGRCPHVT